MTTQWRYLACDLRTDQEIAVLDVAVDSMERRINVAGTFRGSVRCTSAAVRDRLESLIEGRCVLHCYRSPGDLWGSYILWSITPSCNERGEITYQLQGATLESAFGRRRIQADLNYVATDRLTIARNLVAHMQTARAEADLSIVTGTETSGLTGDYVWKATEQATYARRLEELANGTGGFEYMIRTVHADAGRTRTFVAGYPTLTPPDPQIVFSQPGNVVTWSEDRDALRGGTQFRVRGDTVTDDITSTSAPTMSALVADETRLAAGWPVWDYGEDRQGVTDQSTLDGYAQALRDRRGGGIRLFAATVRLDETNPRLHPNALGATVRLRLSNLVYPPGPDGSPGLDKSWRVVGMDISPPQAGRQETAQLIFEQTE